VNFWKRLIGEEQSGAEKKRERSAEAWMDWLDSPNGFERQEAVEMLGRLRHAPALPALLARVNDWVPQVRASAIEAVRGLMEESFIDTWCASLQTIVALDRARRVDHAAFLDEIAAFLCRPGCLARVQAIDPECSLAVSRYVSALGWRAAETDEQRRRLLVQALAGKDIALARTALDRMSALPDEARQQLAEVACRSRFSPVRAAGLRALVEKAEQATALAFIRTMCHDAHPSVRAIAWAAARQWGEGEAVLDDARAMPEREDVPAKRRAAALRFVCMIDGDGAVELCVRSAAGSPAIVRRVAIDVLLARLRGEEQERWLLAALADESAQVQRLAVHAVQRGAFPPDPARVVEIAIRHRNAQALARAFAVLRRYSLWPRLHWLLETLGAELPVHGAQACVAALVLWERDAASCFTDPSAKERERLREDLQRHGPALPAALRNRLAWAVALALNDLEGIGR
jgi:hypothetical protein